MAGEFKKLQRLSWRGITVYYSTLETKVSNDEAEHKKPNRDGSISEPTGNNADVITATCLFVNKGTAFLPKLYSESWYPQVHRRWMDACRDSSIGELVHPERGTMTAVLLTASSSLAASTQDGAKVSCTWRETTELDQDFGATSPITLATNAAESLDALMAGLRVKASLLGAAMPPTSFSFADSMRSIRGITDSASLLAQRGAATFASVRYNLAITRDAIDRMADVTTSSARISIEQMTAAVNEVERLTFVSSIVGRFRVPADMTLGALAKQMKTTVTDLIQLNPSLVRATRVPIDTIVRYSKAAKGGL